MTTDNKLADAQLAAECIREAISTFRLQYMLDQSDGSGLFLTDALAEYLGDDDIGRAREELDRLADSIYGDLAEHDSTSAAPDAPAPVQVDGAGALPPLPHGDAFCDIADWNEESIGMCGAWSEHLSINSRYTMPLYTESSVRTYARAAIAALRQPVPDAVRELPGKWRADKDDDPHSTSLWYQGYSQANKDCADDLESALAHQESRNGSEGEGS